MPLLDQGKYGSRLIETPTSLPPQLEDLFSLFFASTITTAAVGNLLFLDAQILANTLRLSALSGILIATFYTSTKLF